MKLQYHIAKISWTIADKILFVIYGFIFLIQISLLKSSDLALFNILIAINTWIFVLSDSFALQSIIQFGFDVNDRNKVNLISLLLHIIIVVTLSCGVFWSDNFFVSVFNESRFLEIIKYLPVLSILMIPRTYSLKLMMRDHAMNKIFLTNFTFFGYMTYKIVMIKLNSENMSLYDAINIYLGGAALSSAISLILIFRQLNFSRKGNITLREIVRFCLPFTITNGLNTIPKYLDIIILKLFFPLEQIGVYSAAKSLFRFFEEGVNGVNSLIYPASVRYIANKDNIELQSMISKALSFTFVGFIGISLILVLGFAEFLIGFLMKSNFINSVEYFKIILLATLFLPFNILYFVFTASGKHYLLMRMVLISFVFSIITFVLIGFSQISILMPLGYVSFYFIFSIQAIYFVNSYKIVNINFKGLFRSIEDTYKYIEKFVKI